MQNVTQVRSQADDHATGTTVRADNRTAVRQGCWHGLDADVLRGEQAISDALRRIARPLYVLDAGSGEYAAATVGRVELGDDVKADAGGYPVIGHAHPCPLESFGDPAFRADHGLRYAYLTGAMANGIGSCEIVEAMSRAGMLGFFGSAGLSTEKIATAIERIQRNLSEAPYGFNLIHSPGEPGLEAAVVDLYLECGVHLVEASAYLDLTPSLVRYRVQGIRRDPDGRVVTPNRIIAKASRIEVAERFFSPPPEDMLRELVAAGSITDGQARLARTIPVAQDLTAEADSAGHTDNRPALALLPTMLALRDRVQRQHGFARPLRVGAAGGIGTPHAALAAFSLGAGYVVTGSVNQACIEAGTSDAVRSMLAAAEQADIAMAPAADMFEMGVRVQVLKRGTMFAMRAARLFEMYRTYEGIEAIPAAEREKIERNYFRAGFDEILERTRDYFQAHDPRQWERASTDPKHRMALAFRWYLGFTSTWANGGEASRHLDYQIWCGPAMGAFNEWVRGSFLEPPANRSVIAVAMNILFGAAVLYRTGLLRHHGVPLPQAGQQVEPMAVRDLEAFLL